MRSFVVFMRLSHPRDVKVPAHRGRHNATVKLKVSAAFVRGSRLLDVDRPAATKGSQMSFASFMIVGSVSGASSSKSKLSSRRARRPALSEEILISAMSLEA